MITQLNSLSFLEFWKIGVAVVVVCKIKIKDIGNWTILKADDWYNQFKITPFFKKLQSIHSPLMK